jgi:hypothetical protein
MNNKYSPSFYRATWINTGLDAGFAMAMPIRPRWLRDICSLVFSVYYIICANSAEEKVGYFSSVSRTCIYYESAVTAIQGCANSGNAACHLGED